MDSKHEALTVMTRIQSTSETWCNHLIRKSNLIEDFYISMQIVTTTLIGPRVHTETSRSDTAILVFIPSECYYFVSSCATFV